MPAWLALSVQVPTPVNSTAPSTSEQAPLAASVTGSSSDEDATGTTAGDP